MRRGSEKERAPHRGLRVTIVLLVIVLVFELLYCFLVFTDIPFIKHYRDAYIESALVTMNHQWLATKLLPEYMVQEVQAKLDYLQIRQEGINSNRPTHAPVDPNTPTEPTEPTAPVVTEPLTDEERFYELFWELNRSSFQDYLDEHPEALANGWDNIYINEAGLDDNGTSIYTSMGEQVLAIDAPNKILLVRVQGTGYIGVLAIGKDPSQLRCEAAEKIGKEGQKLAKLVDDNGGVLGMTGSGFIDPEGDGNGGLLAGYCVCEGVHYGFHYEMTGYKRIELTRDNKFYITRTTDEVAEDVTDAVEFSPALIVDGELAVGGFYDWNGINPRAAIGQSERDEILMLVIEGRLVGRSIGAEVEELAHIMKRHEGYTAINLDGGTSAVIYYQGEYVTKCSNTNIQSRYLPNAWVYGNYEDR